MEREGIVGPSDGAKPRKVAQAGEIGIIAVKETRGRARARGAFPLGFGRQAIMGEQWNPSGRLVLRREQEAVIGGGEE